MTRGWGSAWPGFACGAMPSGLDGGGETGGMELFLGESLRSEGWEAREVPLPFPCPMTGGASVAERAVEGDFVPLPFPCPMTGRDPAVVRAGEEVLVALAGEVVPAGLEAGAGGMRSMGSSSRLQVGRR